MTRQKRKKVESLRPMVIQLQYANAKRACLIDISIKHLAEDLGRGGVDFEAFYQMLVLALEISLHGFIVCSRF